MNDTTKEIILIDDDYYTQLIDAINHARQSICIEMYIYNDDAIGHRVSSALILAAKRHVSIRVIVDGIGSPLWGSEMSNQMAEANIKTKVYHPLPWRLMQWNMSTKLFTSALKKLIYLLSHINKRNHRKVCIIDNHILFAGSSNISQSHISKEEGGEGWHDINIKLINADLSEIKYSFDSIWGTVTFKNKFSRIIRKFNIDPIFRLNDTFRQRISYYKKLSTELKHCKKRIWIMNAYFIPDQTILNLLISAAHRQVDVRIILPYQSDVFVVSLVSKTFYHLLIDAGVIIYEYSPRVLHAKVLVIDDSMYVGSSNFNYRSFKHDLELDVRVSTEASKAVIEQQFVHDFTCSKFITKHDLAKQSILTRLLGRLLLFIKYWL